MLRLGMGAVLALACLGCDEPAKSTKGSKSNGPGQVELLVFHAEWCVPCKQLRPTLDELAAKYPQVKFRYADFDHEKDLVREFGVQTIPHLVILIDNVIEETFRGAPPRGRLIRSLDEAIANARKTAP